jgi:hypothetical protein
LRLPVARTNGGTQSFASCAKGGNYEPSRDGFMARYRSRIRQHRTRPCQERKDGAPSVAMMHTNLDVKHGPPGLGSQRFLTEGEGCPEEGMLLTQQIKGGLQGRIGLTIYYGFVCALAVRRCTSIPSGRGGVDELSYWHMALYASFALASWWLLRSFRRTSDRIAALLYGLFYAIRIGAHFTSADTLVLAGVGCAIISAGMIAMIVGMIHAISHEEPGNSAMGNPSS